MPGPYRKPHISINRKKYSWVKPVKPQKQEPKFKKPATAELRSIYAKLRKSASWQIPDVLAEAIQWYRRMSIYLLSVDKDRKCYSVPVVKLQLRRDAILAKAQKTILPSGKRGYLEEALKLWEQMVKILGVKVPALGASLKKAKASSKKLDVNKAKIEKKFDPLLTMLAAATNLNVDVGAVSALANCGEGFNYDSTLNKIFYSRDALKRMKKRIRAEGLLPVLLEQVVFTARASAMKEESMKTGRFIPDNQVWVQKISAGLVNVCKWLSTSQDAPNKIIKRTVPKKKKLRKVQMNTNLGAPYGMSKKKLDRTMLRVAAGEDVHKVVGDLAYDEDEDQSGVIDSGGGA
jgi:hypothetical protein